MTREDGWNKTGPVQQTVHAYDNSPVGEDAAREADAPSSPALIDPDHCFFSTCKWIAAYWHYAQGRRVGVCFGHGAQMRRTGGGRLERKQRP